MGLFPLKFPTSDILEILDSLAISEQQDPAENRWKSLHGHRVIMMLKEGGLLV